MRLHSYKSQCECFLAEIKSSGIHFVCPRGAGGPWLILQIWLCNSQASWVEKRFRFNGSLMKETSRWVRFCVSPASFMSVTNIRPSHPGVCQKVQLLTHDIKVHPGCFSCDHMRSNDLSCPVCKYTVTPHLFARKMLLISLSVQTVFEFWHCKWCSVCLSLCAGDREKMVWIGMIIEMSKNI